MQNLLNIFIFLASFAFDTFLMFLLLRFLLQWVHADFYNPLCQSVVRITNFLVIPLRRVIPGLWGHDLSTMVIWIGLTAVKVIGLSLLLGYSFNLGLSALWILKEGLSQIVDLYFYALLLRVILSWINTSKPHPVMGALVPLTEPLLRPIRGFIPPIAGFDFSTLLAMVALQIITMACINPLAMMALRLLK